MGQLTSKFLGCDVKEDVKNDVKWKKSLEDKPLPILAVINTEKYMVKVSEEAFEQVGSVVDNLLKAEFLARLKDLVKTSLKGQRLGVGNL